MYSNKFADVSTFKTRKEWKGHPCSSSFSAVSFCGHASFSRDRETARSFGNPYCRCVFGQTCWTWNMLAHQPTAMTLVRLEIRILEGFKMITANSVNPWIDLGFWWSFLGICRLKLPISNKYWRYVYFASRLLLYNWNQNGTSISLYFAWTAPTCIKGIVRKIPYFKWKKARGPIIRGEGAKQSRHLINALSLRHVQVELLQFVLYQAMT